MTAPSGNHSVYLLKQRLVFGAVLLIFLVRFLSGTLLSQTGSAPFLFEENEVIYRLFLRSGVPQFILSHQLAATAFDILLFVFPALLMVVRHRVFAAFAFLLWLIYFLTFNIVTGHHYHGLAGALVIMVPFCFKDEKRFGLMWEAARYYLLYIFASAALWKIFRGSVFYGEQLSNILKNQQQLLLFMEQGEYVSGALVQYLIAHTGVAHLVLGLNTVLQLSFLSGFFTKRYDWLLLLLALLFVVSNYLVMGIVSAELLVPVLTLVNWNALQERLRLRSA